MKTIIENFIALARKYEQYGKAMKLPDVHNFIGGGVVIYFAQNRTSCAVEFDQDKEATIDVCLYMKQICFHFTATEESVSKTYNRADAFYATLKVNEEEAAQNERTAKRKELEQHRRAAAVLEKELGA